LADDERPIVNDVTIGWSSGGLKTPEMTARAELPEGLEIYHATVPNRR